MLTLSTKILHESSKTYIIIYNFTQWQIKIHQQINPNNGHHALQHLATVKMFKVCIPIATEAKYHGHHLDQRLEEINPKKRVRVNVLATRLTIKTLPQQQNLAIQNIA